MDAIIKGSKMYGAVVSDDPAIMQALSHPLRIRILRMLLEGPMYPIEIARRLGMIEQKVYYHVKQMKAAGILEEIGETQKRGGKARLLRPVAAAFGYVFPEARSGEVVSYADFPPFVKGGVVDAKLVVGSPDPHGKSRARARDGHLSSEVAAFFARMGTIPWPFVYEDTELKSLNGNLILLGGPVVNTVVERVNNVLPVQFIDRSIKTPVKEYSEDWVGLVALADNPFDPGRRIMVIAGRTRSGTRAAILGLRNFFDSLEKGYIVVQGFDEDGDGIVDSVDLVE